ncbi:universal stress protein [Natribacillus halophilus]|uniref:Universal stress protein family protein n=1 Tax=Natribacillus halophilus TaxID=549003 RepID=A0A1G8QFB5_9BACI|nr:universal stress protein [Natribacillus halophilus]SDJ03391.1 Universal stress protein family protein [Natribacillus halophilus]
MDQIQAKMDECMLVCVYYGPNGEKLIKRGAKIAGRLNCPLYILTVNDADADDLDHEKNQYLEFWERLAKEYNATDFIIKSNDKRPVSRVISQVAKEIHATQVIIGQTAKSRWKEMTKGSLINSLLKELPFVDLHIIAVTRGLKNYQEEHFEKGVRAYLVKTDGGRYRLSFNHTNACAYEGIFFKEIGTDFNNGVFKFMKENRMIDVHVTDDYVQDEMPSHQKAENTKT